MCVYFSQVHHFFFKVLGGSCRRVVSTVKNMHYNMWVTNHSEIKRAKHFKILKDQLYDYGIVPSVFYSRIMWKIVQDILKLYFF